MKVFCYCAFCRNPRTISRRKSFSFMNFLQALGIALSLSYLFWQGLNPKALPIFVVVLMLLEIAVLIRARFELTCPHCGFDPVLYAKNKDAACSKVKKYIELRQNDPDVWLARRPPLRFGKRKKKVDSTREIVV
jgi:hypothetical protein